MPHEYAAGKGPRLMLSLPLSQLLQAFPDPQHASKLVLKLPEKDCLSSCRSPQQPHISHSLIRTIGEHLNLEEKEQMAGKQRTWLCTAKYSTCARHEQREAARPDYDHV